METGQLIAAAAAVLALWYLGLTVRPAGLLRSAVKTGSVALLALAAWLAGAPGLLVAALLLCAAGDLCLSRNGETAFMAGVGAFAAGHLAYAVLFLSRPESSLARLAELPWILLAAVLAAMGAVMARLLAPRAGALTLPVLCYIPIILGMGMAALTLPGNGGLALVLPAALAFILSDLVLAAETFVLAEHAPARRITPYAVWPLYWGAQAGFLAAFS